MKQTIVGISHKGKALEGSRVKNVLESYAGPQENDFLFEVFERM